MANDVVDSECSGFGLEFDPEDSDCQGCQDGFPGEYAACKALYEAKQLEPATEPAVDEEDISIDKEAKIAESELDDENDSDDLDIPTIPEEEPVEPVDFVPVVAPPVEPEKDEVVKKYRRIETFARLIRQGESWLPSELANAVDREAAKTYKPGVTAVVVTQWLKLLFLIGIVEKMDGGLYRMKSEFLSNN